MSWILFALLAAITWAIINTIDKLILTKYVKNPIIPLVVLCIINILAGIVVYYAHGFSRLSIFGLIIALLGGTFYLLGALFYFKAVKLEEISRVVALFSFTPLVVAILAYIFLGESFNAYTYLGIILIVLGAYLISTNNFTRIRSVKTLGFVLLATLSFSILYIITKYLLNYADFWTVFGIIRISIIIPLIPLYIMYFKPLKELFNRPKLFVGLTMNESFNLVGTFFVTLAISLGPVTLVDTMVETQPFFNLLIAVILSIFYPYILKEEISASTVFIKFVAIVLMFVGVNLIL